MENIYRPASKLLTEGYDAIYFPPLTTYAGNMAYFRPLKRFISSVRCGERTVVVVNLLKSFLTVLFVILFFVLHWYLSLFSQTFFQHRYAAHKAFTMNRGWEKFFFVFSYFTQGSSYLSPRAYGILHRLHHAHTDTELDPHSPSYDKNLFAMMWRTKKIYSGILYETTPVEEKFTKNVPTWKRFDLLASSWPSRALWLAIYVTLYLLFAPSAWFLILIPIHAAMGPLHGVIINWYAHRYGHVNYETDNTSKNLFKIDWLMFGEGYHNNHHTFPSHTNFATKKGEFDPCYPLILLLSKLRVIRTSPPGPLSNKL